MATKITTEENNILGVGIPSDELTQTELEERNAVIRANEYSILDSLLAAASFQEETRLINVYRSIKNEAGNNERKVVLSFHIHPLSEEEYARCLRAHTKPKKNRGGVIVSEKTDQSAYRSDLIFLATTVQDRDIWQNAEALRKLDVATPWQLIDKVLMAGEKAEILNILDEISGYKNDDDIAEESEEGAKN